MQRIERGAQGRARGPGWAPILHVMHPSFMLQTNSFQGAMIFQVLVLTNRQAAVIDRRLCPQRLLPTSQQAGRHGAKMAAGQKVTSFLKGVREYVYPVLQSSAFLERYVSNSAHATRVCVGGGGWNHMDRPSSPACNAHYPLSTPRPFHPSHTRHNKPTNQRRAHPAGVRGRG